MDGVQELLRPARGPDKGQGRGRPPRRGGDERDGETETGIERRAEKLGTQVRRLSPSWPPERPYSTSSTLCLPWSRPRPGSGRLLAGRAGSGLAALAVAPASVPRSAPAGEVTMGTSVGREGAWGSRVRPGAALTSASEPRVTSSLLNWPCCCR